uniref:Peptidase S1 domain-containing protein n=3 Tax=Ciona intestinalis TaxID=7719 RepID=F6S741_CIOIN
MEYEDCKNMDCPPKSCPRGSFPRYGTNTKCCTPDNENCGSFFGNDNDIVGGVAADKRSWPWMLRLRLGNPRGGSFASCGASLIHSRWAITATHCILTFTGPRQILAIASQTRYVHKVYKHEGFSSWLENDISLLEFKEPFEFNPETNIAPVCLPWNEETPDDTQCFAAGWGATDPADLRPSNTLQQVRLRNLNMDVCRYAYDQAPGDPFRIPNADKLNETTMICAGRLRGGADTCAGDSGGPLMCQRCSTCSWYIAGITSYGTANCGASGRPGVYTKVLAYEPWIRETTRGEIQRIRDFRGSCSIQNTLQ